MTRKRFVKQMMSAGASKKVADALARQRPASQSYCQWFGLCSMVFAAKAMSVALRASGEAFARAASQLGDAFGRGTGEEVPQGE